MTSSKKRGGEFTLLFSFDKAEALGYHTVEYRIRLICNRELLSSVCSNDPGFLSSDGCTIWGAHRSESGRGPGLGVKSNSKRELKEEATVIEMKMQELRIKAKALGINSFGKSKAGLIREIQRAEGNFDCFGSAEDFCDQNECSFRSICLNQKPDPKSNLN